MSVSASAVLELSGESTPVSDLLRGVARSWRLLPMLAKQDYMARYRSAALGLLWSVFLPLLQGAVLAVVFTHVVRVRTDTPSYAVFVLAGMTAWAYLSTSWSLGSTSIVDSSAIASRVYFPRLLLPAVAPTANLIGYVLVIALNAVCALLHVYFRDVRYLVSALLLVLFYATPVIYPLSFTHGILRAVVLVNPGTGVVQLTRF